MKTQLEFKKAPKGLSQNVTKTLFSGLANLSCKHTWRKPGTAHHLHNTAPSQTIKCGGRSIMLWECLQQQGLATHWN